MPDYNFKNNLKSTLQSKLWSDATSIYCKHVVESEDADTRRNAWPAFPFTLTLVDTANDNIEIIKCTSLANNSSDAIVFHCDRAQENTTAQTFEIATTSVEHRLTSEALNSITNAVSPATTTARGIGRVATLAEALPGSTITNGPAFLDAATWKVAAAPAAGIIPLADSNGKLDAWVSPQTQHAACATAAATAAKDATLTGFVLAKGARVLVTFSNANTVAGALTLNVNGTGAKPIYDESGQAVSATNPAYFLAGCKIEFVYDGTNWVYFRRVVSSYVSGANWWHKRNDGWIEQNVHSTQSSANNSVTISLLVQMKDTNYTVTPTYYGNGVGIYSSVTINSKTVSSLSFGIGDTPSGADFLVQGY